MEKAEHLRTVRVDWTGYLGHPEASESSEATIEEVDETSWSSAGPCTMNRISFIYASEGQYGEGGGGAAVPIGRPARHIMIGSWTPITTSITPQGEIHEVKRTELEQRRAFYAHQLDIEAAHE